MSAIAAIAVDSFRPRSHHAKVSHMNVSTFRQRLGFLVFTVLELALFVGFILWEGSILVPALTR